MPIAIVGGGPAGMALALALAHHGGLGQIFDARPRGGARRDPRILALSEGSRQILEWLGVWSAIPTTPIDAIHVSQQGGFGRTRLSAAEQGVPALGYVAAAADIGAALDDALEKRQLPFRDDVRVNEVACGESAACLTTTAGSVEARLVVYAEGGVNDDADKVERDYGQQAVVCTVTPKTPHGNRAFERFTRHGPLALLPCGRDMAVVYGCAADTAAALAAQDDEVFLAGLQTQFGSRVEFSAVSPRHLFPLRLRYRRSPVGQRAVWLGNAAQTLHPVAGQGFNLALRDVWELARAIGAAEDPGAAGLLAAYAARRRLDRQGAIRFTDTLVRLFSNDDPLLRPLRGFGLLALDLLPPARNFLAKRMMYGARAWP